MLASRASSSSSHLRHQLQGVFSGSLGSRRVQGGGRRSWRGCGWGLRRRGGGLGLPLWPVLRLSRSGRWLPLLLLLFLLSLLLGLFLPSRISLWAVSEELAPEVLKAVAPATPAGLDLLEHHAVEEADELPRVAAQPVEHLVTQQVAEFALFAAQAHLEQLEVAQHEEVEREAVVAPGRAAVQGR